MRMRRMMLGMSQEKLGKAFGLTFQQVQKYEKGKNRMGSSRLQQAADILGVTAPFFFAGADGGSFKPDGSAPSPACEEHFGEVIPRANFTQPVNGRYFGAKQW
jgi:transcriptional regulator with XRE-family HTH domain